MGGSANGPGSGQTIAVYSVGGDGVLFFQEAYQSEGYVSQWAQMDSSGTYLFVLDKYAPGQCTQSLYSAGKCTGPEESYTAPNTDGNGAITVFQADASTGRLTLVTNLQTLQNGVNTPFWEVGPSPIMSKTIGSCLYTVNDGETNGLQTITPFSISTGGQLDFTTTGNITIPLPQITAANGTTTTGVPTNITSINGSSSYVFLTDAANNVLYGYDTSSTCSLTALNGGTTNLATDFPYTSNPSYTLIDSTGKYLYVTNGSTTSTQTTVPYSSLSGLTINSTNQELQPLSTEPYPVGSGPTCIAEDPTNQYIYTSNNTAGTITGFQLNADSGELSNLVMGSTFTTVGKASCFAISGVID